MYTGPTGGKIDPEDGSCCEMPFTSGAMTGKGILYYPDRNVA